MKKVPKLLFFAATIMVLVTALAGSVSAASADTSGPASGDGVVPILWAGNPSCDDIGYGFGFKINQSPNGTFPFDLSNGGELTGGAPSDPYNSVTISNSNNQYFDWSATLGIDAVIVKAGNNANAYVYIPEDTADTSLHSPINPANGQPRTISHIEFCYDYELTASKTANAEYTRTYTWTIDKSVSPDTHTGFTGDSFSSDYAVVVDQTVADSDFAVSGLITVNNPTPFVVSFSVSDLVGATAATVDCPTYSLAAGASTVCTYSADFGDTNPGDGTNMATITSTTAEVGGTTASANYTFNTPTNVEGYPTINVTDSVEGDLGSASDDKTFTYSRTFTCDEDEGENPNTATIDETGQFDSALVTVDCYELAVTKDADTSFTRTWEWTIDKSADQTDLLLSDGQLFQVNYEVTVDATSTDSDHAVNGNIAVYNPAPIAAAINSVSDIVSPAIAATVSCGVTFPYTLAAGGTLNCTYSADLPDDADRTNTATATLQNYDYDSEGVGTASGTTDFSHTINVAFGDTPDEEIDECVDVNDTNVGFLGTVCASDAPKTFNYSLTFGKHVDADVMLECEENTHVNTASFVTNDTDTTGEDDWTVNADVACLYGCTLTQGYWKTHSKEGPAPYDDAWQNLSFLEEDTLFFISLKTWYQVFWTPPAGNPYYNLAHQYMAAKLNILNGASTTPAVEAAISSAETFFWTHLPSVKLSKAARANVLMWAATLDQYNNGYIGPGHCDE